MGITFTYTAAGSISSGGLQIIIPTGWSEPQVATPSGEGFINAYGGASNPANDRINMASVNGSIVTIPVSLSANSTVVVSFKSAIAPTQAGANNGKKIYKKKV